MIAARRGFDRLLALTASISAAVLFVPLFIPLATGRIFASDDLTSFHLPVRFLYARALEDGSSILWTPYLFNGFYLHAEGQVGALHPWHLALYSLLPLQVAFNVEFIGSYAAAFVGMWFFLRRSGLASAAALVGAVGFTFSGFLLLHHVHLNAVAIAAHIPWLLVAVHLVLEESGRSRALAFGAIALLVGSQVLLGYPQYVWLSVLVCAMYAIVFAPTRAWLPAAAGVLGLLVGGAQLLPTLDLLTESQREVVSREFALSYSLHPLNLLQLWSPYLFEARVFAKPNEPFIHEFGLYNGAFCTIALAYAVAWRRKMEFQGLTVFALAICAVGSILAIGRYGFVYEAVASLPVVGIFRAPARHVLLVHTGLTLLAAVTFDHLLRHHGSRSGSNRLILATVLISAAIAIAAFIPGWDAFIPGSSGRGGLTGAILIGTAALLVHQAAMARRAAIVLLPAFFAFDLAAWGYTYIWQTPPRTIEATIARFPIPEYVGGTLYIETADTRRNLVVLRGMKLLNPYVGLAPLRAAKLRDENALRVAGVSWTYQQRSWRKVDAPLPRARLVFDARVSTDPEVDLPTIDVERTVIVPPGARELDGQGEGHVEVVRDEPGTLTIDVSSPAVSWLVLTESYHSGWVATTAAGPLKTKRVYGDSLGVLVEPGTHRVELAFRPDSTRLGLWASIVGLLAVAALTAGRVFNTRTKDVTAGA